MTNEEKARLIAEQWRNGEVYTQSKISALEMADWKDQQFKEYLKKKKTYYSCALTTFDVMRKKVYDEIINELFGEEVKK